MTEVVAGLIWNDNNKFLICRRAKHKARGLLWEFAGGKVENGETKKEALIRELREELSVSVSVGEIFSEINYKYTDDEIRLTVFSAKIKDGQIKVSEKIHCEAKWISPDEISLYPFCPADKEILVKIASCYLTGSLKNNISTPLTVTLGKTGITVPKNGFGALPIQRVSDEYACKILRKAYESGITFFDTARAYSDSERKIGIALSDVREKIFIATKTGASDRDGFFRDLETSLKNLKTSYIDIYQLHNPAFCPKPDDKSGLYNAMLEAKSQGLIKHIGITNHRLNVASEAVLSGLYETLQFPFCYLATEKDIELVELCKNHNIGFIAMKGLSGGLITNSAAAYAWMAKYQNVLPIWGVQRENELEEFISYTQNPPQMDGTIADIINKDRKDLIGSFCRGCGYCMPCPAGIEINNCARMSQLIRRSPSANWLTEESQKKMFNIENCIGCGHCKEKCPYGLDTPELLKANLSDYKKILSGEIKI